MIYLRPSHRITPPGEGDPVIDRLDVLEEYMRGLQRARTPFTLVIESEHGSDLDKEGVRDTVLHLRIYGHDGSDLTDLLPADFAPEWYRDETQVGVGMSLALTWQDVKTYSQTYSVTLTAWRIYKALSTQEPIEPGIERLFSEISCRGEFVLQGSIRFISDRLGLAEAGINSANEELRKKLDATAFESFKKQIGTLPTDKTLTEHIDELPTTPKVYDILRNQARSTYTVKVFIDGQIRNGKMDVTNPTDPTTQQPAVLHWAMASNLLSGQAAADFYNSLKWTVNKGRTTDPKERTVTGSRCYVLAKDIVTPTDGSVPYYDIQLERLT